MKLGVPSVFTITVLALVDAHLTAAGAEHAPAMTAKAAATTNTAVARVPAMEVALKMVHGIISMVHAINVQRDKEQIATIEPKSKVLKK